MFTKRVTMGKQLCFLNYVKKNSADPERET